MTNSSKQSATVSVIIPVFNRQHYIQEAIESVLRQTYPPLEIIVIDDGSTDDTADVVAAFNDRVRYVYRENGGPAVARNNGLKLATGEFIAFLDSDDIWPAGKLETQITYLQEHPESHYAVGRVVYFLEPGASPPPGFRTALLEGSQPGRLLQAMVARREVFDIVGPFDARLRTAEDVDWFCRANDLSLTMAMVQEIVVNIRIHRTNTVLETTRNNQNLLRVLRQSVLRKNRNRC